MLVCNHRNGSDWIPGTIVEVLGPVTYVVDTDTGLCWKRHTDQIKEWIAAKPRVEPETEQESSGTDTAATAVDPEYLTSEDESGTDNGDTAPPADIPSTEETRTSGTKAGSSTPTKSTSAVTERRYPTRARQPPERYSSSVAGTFSILVC